MDSHDFGQFCRKWCAWVAVAIMAVALGLVYASNDYLAEDWVKSMTNIGNSLMMHLSLVAIVLVWCVIRYVSALSIGVKIMLIGYAVDRAALFSFRTMWFEAILQAPDGQDYVDWAEHYMKAPITLGAAILMMTGLVMVVHGANRLSSRQVTGIVAGLIASAVISTAVTHSTGSGLGNYVILAAVSVATWLHFRLEYRKA